MGASKSYAPSEQLGAADFRIRPLADKFLYRGALVRVNAYKCTKFQLPSSISYWDMDGIPKYKLGAADLLRRILADKRLHVAIVPAYAYQRTKFQLSSSISFGYEGCPKIKIGIGSSWFPQTHPSGQIFIPGTSTRKCLQVCQISTS